MANIAACAASDREVVVAPMAPTPVVDAGTDAASGDGDGGGEGGARHATRALREPANKPGCKRMVRCRAKDEDEQAVPYPDPYAHCAPVLSKTDRETPFSPKETAKARASEADVCCYVEFRECENRGVIHIMEGRALRTGGLPRRPATGPVAKDLTARARRAQRRPRVPSDAHAARTQAAKWTRAAEHEHASIATFARISLELLALGAPMSLVVQCQRAATDEVRHAEDAYALASAYAGQTLGARPFAEACAPLVPDLRRLARETLVDGCIGESAAALHAANEARATDDPAVKSVLLRVARDEARHAELAFRMLSWMLLEGGAAVRDEIARELDLHSRAATERDEARSLAVHSVTTPLVSLLLQRPLGGGNTAAQRSS